VYLGEELQREPPEESLNPVTNPGLSGR
jgi:hypothetical protein